MHSNGRSFNINVFREMSLAAKIPNPWVEALISYREDASAMLRSNAVRYVNQSL
jgi:hypothetical protein